MRVNKQRVKWGRRAGGYGAGGALASMRQRMTAGIAIMIEYTSAFTLATIGGVTTAMEADPRERNKGGKFKGM
jgi:hypothetical protein